MKLDLEEINNFLSVPLPIPKYQLEVEEIRAKLDEMEETKVEVDPMVIVEVLGNRLDVEVVNKVPLH